MSDYEEDMRRLRDLEEEVERLRAIIEEGDTLARQEVERLHSQMYSSQPYYYDYWKKELVRIEAALAIHGQGPSQGVTTRRWCRVCDDEVWPCPTVKALKGGE